MALELANKDGMCSSSVSRRHGEEKVMSFTTIIAYVGEEAMFIAVDGKNLVGR